MRPSSSADLPTRVCGPFDCPRKQRRDREVQLWRKRRSVPEAIAVKRNGERMAESNTAIVPDVFDGELGCLCIRWRKDAEPNMDDGFADRMIVRQSFFASHRFVFRQFNCRDAVWTERARIVFRVSSVSPTALDHADTVFVQSLDGRTRARTETLETRNTDISATIEIKVSNLSFNDDPAP